MRQLRKDPASAENVVNYLSFNLLQDGSPRFIATVMAAYVFFGYVMYTMLREFSWFNEQRYNSLRRFKQQNYSILVRNIPKDLRSNNLLLGYFQSVYGSERGKKVLGCHNSLDEVLSILLILSSFHSPRGTCVYTYGGFRSDGEEQGGLYWKLGTCVGRVCDKRASPQTFITPSSCRAIQSVLPKANQRSIPSTTTRLNSTSSTSK
jgi:hypothetical protein